MDSVQEKYIPIKNYKIYTATLDPKVDPDTMQPIGDSLLYQYKVVLDKFNNVYMLPMKDGKSMFSMLDIVEAAGGKREKIEKIENIRNQILDENNADLLGEEWKDYLYKELINNITNKSVQAELEEDTKRLLNEIVKLPDHVSGYEELSKNKNQIKELIDSACVLDKSKLKSHGENKIKILKKYE